MKRFLVIATQNGGCDYTIGCGISTWVEESESMEQLKIDIERKLLMSEDDDDYEEGKYYEEGEYFNRLPVMGQRYAGEYCYDGLTVYEIGETYSFNLKALSIKKSDEMKRKQLEKKEKDQRAQYESLKSKFEKDGK